MRDLVILFIHLITTLARLASPRGARSVVAESVLVKHQLLILSRSQSTLLGHNWATSAREYGVTRAISSQLRAFRINTGHRYDMPGSHEVVGSIPTRSTS